MAVVMADKVSLSCPQRNRTILKRPGYLPTRALHETNSPVFQPLRHFYKDFRGGMTFAKAQS